MLRTHWDLSFFQYVPKLVDECPTRSSSTGLPNFICLIYLLCHSLRKPVMPENNINIRKYYEKSVFNWCQKSGKGIIDLDKRHLTWKPTSNKYLYCKFLMRCPFYCGSKTIDHRNHHNIVWSALPDMALLMSSVGIDIWDHTLYKFSYVYLCVQAIRRNDIQNIVCRLRMQ